MPKYHVRLTDPDDNWSNTCWHTDVPVKPHERLSNAEVERRAVANAVGAFGRQAAGWKLLDAQRKR
jgi:hypothetical protein